jgi:integrase
VDIDGGVVRLEPGETKNGEARTFPFLVDPALGDLLVRQMKRTLALRQKQGRIIPWVFHIDGEPIGLFTKSWKRACRVAGCPGRLVHDLRRTAVRNLERAGVARSVAMKLIGHRTESIYKRYAIVSEADLSEAVKKAAERRGG